MWKFYFRRSLGVVVYRFKQDFLGYIILNQSNVVNLMIVYLSMAFLGIETYSD